MMDARLLSTLHTQLAKIKSNPDSDFGNVNILFAGDFLQLLTKVGSRSSQSDFPIRVRPTFPVPGRVRTLKSILRLDLDQVGVTAL